MFKRIDRSAFLSRIVDRLSDTVANQRGLPILIGVILIVVSFILQFINVLSPAPALQLIGVISLHVGVLTALIGLLLVTPLGK